MRVGRFEVMREERRAEGEEGIGLRKVEASAFLELSETETLLSSFSFKDYDKGIDDETCLDDGPVLVLDLVVIGVGVASGGAAELTVALPERSKINASSEHRIR